jgi:hypothetical protein
MTLDESIKELEQEITYLDMTRQEKEAELRKVRLERQKRDYAPISLEHCHAAWNKRNKTWYVRTNISSPVGGQVHCGVYGDKDLAGYVAEKLNHILEVVSKRETGTWTPYPGDAEEPMA